MHEIQTRNDRGAGIGPHLTGLAFDDSFLDVWIVRRTSTVGRPQPYGDRHEPTAEQPIPVIAQLLAGLGVVGWAVRCRRAA